MRRRRDEVSCASSPFSLVKDASRSAQPTKFEALAVTIRWSSLYIADCVIDQRPVKCLLWVTSSGLIMSRLGQVSLTKPTYRRIVLRCCSVPQAKPSPDYEYRISLRPHPVGHPSSSTRDSAAGRSRPRYASGATGIGKLENGSRPKAISEVERLRRSLPEPGPENRAAISIRSARPPIIAVIGGLAAPDRQRHWLSVAAEVIVRPLAVPARPGRPGAAAQMVSPATGRRSQGKPGRRSCRTSGGRLSPLTWTRV